MKMKKVQEKKSVMEMAGTKKTARCLDLAVSGFGVL